MYHYIMSLFDVSKKGCIRLDVKLVTKDYCRSNLVCLVCNVPIDGSNYLRFVVKLLQTSLIKLSSVVIILF